MLAKPDTYVSVPQLFVFVPCWRVFIAVSALIVCHLCDSDAGCSSFPDPVADQETDSKAAFEEQHKTLHGSFSTAAVPAWVSTRHCKVICAAFELKAV